MAGTTGTATGLVTVEQTGVCRLLSSCPEARLVVVAVAFFFFSFFWEGLFGAMAAISNQQCSNLSLDEQQMEHRKVTGMSVKDSGFSVNGQAWYEL